MLRAGARWLLVGLLVVLSGASAWSSEVRSGMARLPGHVVPALSHATKVRSAADAESLPVTLTIVLRRDDEGAFTRRLHDIYDRHSKAYHHFLNQREIADRFGPSSAEYQQLITYLQTNGFEVIEHSENRLTLTVRGNRAQAERAFAVHISDYRIGRQSFFANDLDPAVPLAISAHVSAIAGLSNLAKPQVTSSAISQAFSAVVSVVKTTPTIKVVNDAAGASSTSTASNGPQDPPGGWLGNDGTGQTIGLVEFDTFSTSDIVNYLALVGQPASQIGNLSQVHVAGGASAGPNEDEVLLDIDAIETVAPGAKIVVYDGPFTGAGSFQQIFNQMISDGVTIISNSWAYCEDQTSAADVESLDAIFQNAAAAGITVLNGAGDGGSTCLDGAANTISVPADSPNATAVGGSSLTFGVGLLYGQETWWDGAVEIPPSGLGGFGVSKFFARPSYQAGLNPSTFRSIPDVVTNADPASGVVICQQDNGGCPNGLLFGGTSVAAPIWAAFVAILNEAQGANLGALNPLLYPLAADQGFHNPASMGSDFEHVGLGSPNLNPLHLLLANQTAGAVSSTQSQFDLLSPMVALVIPPAMVPSVPTVVAADGKTQGFIEVRLRDANGNTVAGKTVTLTANGGSAQISPSSGVSTVDNGAVIFTITDESVESVTLTATDQTDGVQLANMQTISFGVPPATGASIGAAPSSVNNDGKAQATITVTLKDTLGRPTPGKLVNLSQTGSSIATGPSPQVTDANGDIQFFATDVVSETVTYSAVDVTDGNLPVPGSASVTFTGSPSNSCGSGLPPAAPGFVVTPYASGFNTQSVSAGGVNFGCWGASGLAFDSSGNLYVNEFPTGNIYKFPPGGGVAGASTQLNSTSLGVTLAGLAFDKSGNLFASLDVTTGNFTTGLVEQIDPSNGSVIKTVSSPLTCPTTISIDPLSGDLFTDDICSGAGSDNASIWRVAGPGGASPTTSVYATLPGTPNATLAFAPGGTIYAWAIVDGEVMVAEVSGTNGPTPPTINVLPGLQLSSLGLLAGGTGAGTFLIGTPYVNNATVGINSIDLTTSPPSLSTSFATASGANFMTFGPDGCVYASQGTTVFKITAADGSCSYGSSLGSATLVLAPTSVSPNPAQGSQQSFTASFHFASVPDGTPVTLNVSGANPNVLQANTTSGVASFSYTGLHQGIDNLTAAAMLSGSPLTSNNSVVTWAGGTDVTFLTLNQSPTTGTTGQPVNLTANLTDVSLTPATELSGQLITFTLGSANCSASTDSNGNATCQVTASGSGTITMSAKFAGTSQYNPSSASKGFNVLAPTPTPGAPTSTPTAVPTPKPTPPPTPTPTPPTPTPTPRPTPTPTPRPTSTPTPRPTPTPTPRPTPTPIPTPTPKPTPKPTPTPTPRPTPTPTPTPSGHGRLLILPPGLVFVTQVGAKSPPLVVAATNLSLTGVQFSDVTVSGSSFAIYKNACQGNLAPLRTCLVTVTFSPKQLGQFDGALQFTDTANGSPQSVWLHGTAVK